jgi:GTP-binding protein YchF
MEVGIIGLPLAGKTTLYNALTRSRAEVARYNAGRCEIHTAIVDVPDPRVGTLVQLFNPRKTAYAKIQFNDIGGVDQGQAKNGGFAPEVLNAMSKCDALVQVVRAFDDALAPHPAGSIDPARDLAALRLELILSDLLVVERRLERIQLGLKKGRDAALLERERLLMERFKATLEDGGLIGDLELTAEERALIRGFQFLTAKPALVVVNLPEDAAEEPDLSWADHRPNTRVLALRGALEMEIAQLPPEEMAPFLESYGISEPSLPLLVRECYRLLGLMSFFTVGEDEVRAWTVRQGATALEAAGTIHSDLARGFIRAEVISYEDMIACGTLTEARRQGKLRLEGKEYRLQDGDILNIRFNL